MPAYVSGVAVLGACAGWCAAQKPSVAEMQAQGCRIPDKVPQQQEDVCWHGVTAWEVMLLFYSNTFFLEMHCERR